MSNFSSFTITDPTPTIGQAYRFFIQPGDISWSIEQQAQEQIKYGAYVDTIESGRRVATLPLLGTIECGPGYDTVNYQGISRRAYNGLKAVVAQDRNNLRSGAAGSVTLDVDGVVLTGDYLKLVQPSPSILYTYSVSDAADLQEWFSSVTVTISSPSIVYL